MVIVQLINFIVSIALYYTAPLQYSNVYCICAMVSFFLSVYFYIRTKKILNYFCFFIIFSMTFYIVFFLYPVFGYSNGMSFWFTFNENTINKATLLAAIGYNSFVLGLLVKLRNTRCLKEIVIASSSGFMRGYGLQLILLIMSDVLTFVKFFIFGVNRYTDASLVVSEGVWGGVQLFQHPLVVATLAIMAKNIYCEGNRKLYFIEKFIIVLILLDCIMNFLNGYRGGALCTILMILTSVIMIKDKFSFIKILVITLVGLCLMNFIMLARQGLSQAYSIDILKISYDLIIVNYLSYVSYDYVANFGSVPFTQIGTFLGIIPFIRGVLKDAFNLNYYDFSSADYLSYYVQSGNVNVGLGTNIIASLYLAFGFMGVAMLMFVLGYFIETISTNTKNGSVLKIMLYFEMMGISVYIVRSEFFWPFGFLFYDYLFLCLFKKCKINFKI